jgi:hypothetical protein
MWSPRPRPRRSGRAGRPADRPGWRVTRSLVLSQVSDLGVRRGLRPRRRAGRRDRVPTGPSPRASACPGIPRTRRRCRRPRYRPAGAGQRPPPSRLGRLRGQGRRACHRSRSRLAAVHRHPLVPPHVEMAARGGVTRAGRTSVGPQAVSRSRVTSRGPGSTGVRRPRLGVQLPTMPPPASHAASGQRGCGSGGCQLADLEHHPGPSPSGGGPVPHVDRARLQRAVAHRRPVISTCGDTRVSAVSGPDPPTPGSGRTAVAGGWPGAYTGGPEDTPRPRFPCPPAGSRFGDDGVAHDCLADPSASTRPAGRASPAARIRLSSAYSGCRPRFSNV